MRRSPPRRSIGPAGTVLTVRANGGELSLHVGERRTVRLEPPGLEGEAWTRLSVSDPTLAAFAMSVAGTQAPERLRQLSSASPRAPSPSEA